MLPGDLRQTIPVLPCGTPEDELNACLKASYLWMEVEKMTLPAYMCVHLQGDQTAGAFAALLLQMGAGKIYIPAGCGNIVCAVQLKN